MNFNPEKCKPMHLGARNPWQTYTINSVPIENVRAHKDLGIVISDDLKPSKHIGNIVKKANSVPGQIKRSFSVRSRQVVVDLYKNFVRPHLEFAVQVWNPWLAKDIEALEKSRGEQ
jgi:hypothetical protein